MYRKAMSGWLSPLPSGTGAYAYWQIRTYAHTNGPQLVAPSHFIFGLSYALH